jgi:hypothetical protein
VGGKAARILGRDHRIRLWLTGSERVKPHGQGGDAFVGRENALAVGDQRRPTLSRFSLILRTLLMYSLIASLD